MFRHAAQSAGPGSCICNYLYYVILFYSVVYIMSYHGLEHMVSNPKQLRLYATCFDNWQSEIEMMAMSIRDGSRSPGIWHTHARIQGFLGGNRKPPLRLSAIFFCLLICPGPCNNLDPLLKFLYEPPPSECTKPPLLNPGSVPDTKILEASFYTPTRIIYLVSR